MTRTSLVWGYCFWKWSPLSTPFVLMLWLSCTKVMPMPASSISRRLYVSIRILWELSDRIASEEGPLRRAFSAMADLDALFARAKLSVQMDARPAEISAGRRIRLNQARHPLLDAESCVPLDLRFSSS